MTATRESPAENLDHASVLLIQLRHTLNALADIALSEDITLSVARRKALRVYTSVCDALVVAEKALEDSGEVKS